MNLSCTILTAGTCKTFQRIVEPQGRWRLVQLPAMFALIEHPQRGTVLFDTGYSPRYFTGTRRFPHVVYRVAVPVQVDAEQTAAAQLRRRGVAPDEVGWVIISHFDPDHCGGLGDFPSARVVCSRLAWQWLRSEAGPLHIRLRILPNHLPRDLDRRVHLVDEPSGPAVGDVFPTADLFGDGSILLVSLPGHAPGQMGAVVLLGDGRRLLLAADACYSRQAIESCRLHEARFQRLIAHDPQTQLETCRRLQRLSRRCPDITIVPTHCRQAAAELLSTTL